MPDQKGRLEILKVHARNKKLGEDVDLSEVASRVPGFTGADLANLLNEVGRSPARPHHLTWPSCFCCLLPVGGFALHLSGCAEEGYHMAADLSCAFITTEVEFSVSSSQTMDVRCMLKQDAAGKHPCICKSAHFVTVLP